MMYRRIIAPILIATNLFISPMAFAQTAPTVTTTLPSAPEKLPGEPDVGAAISPLKKLQIAPFTGVLLSPEATAQLIVQITTFPQVIKIQVDHQAAVDKAQCDFSLAEQKNTLETDKKILQAQVDASNKIIPVLTEQVKKLEDSRPNTTLWFGLGAAAGVVVTVLLTLAIAYAGHAAGL